MNVLTIWLNFLYLFNFLVCPIILLPSLPYRAIDFMKGLQRPTTITLGYSFIHTNCFSQS